MTEAIDLRHALLELHGALLKQQQIQVERLGGRMSAPEVLQAATQDPQFWWLRELSSLIATLDQARGDQDEDEVRVVIAAMRALLDPPHPDTDFGRRYLQALQDYPDVVLAHRDVSRALGFWSGQGSHLCITGEPHHSGAGATGI